MYPSTRPFLMLALLLAIGLRTVLGAPCCMDGGVHGQAQIESAEHAEHAQHVALDDEHSDHGDSPAANPCCSACGPTLPPEPVQFALITAPRVLPTPDAIRALATRPPYPAYEATGPPLPT